jgi:hypothetical protein
VDVKAVQRDLELFIHDHKSQFEDLSARHSQLLEMAGMAAAVGHYQAKGYSVVPDGLVNGIFRVNMYSRAHPWNFSWWRIERDGNEFEIRTNLKVRGAYGLDDATYVLDVAIVQSGSVPRLKVAREWRLPNSALVTFIEVKALVHELKPSHLGGAIHPEFLSAGHFSPALASLGYLQGISRGICAAFHARRFEMVVIPNLDRRLAMGGPLEMSRFGLD